MIFSFMIITKIIQPPRYDIGLLELADSIMGRHDFRWDFFVAPYHV